MKNKKAILPIILSAAALVLTVIMTLHSLEGTALIGCGAGSSCDSVLGGRWSKLFGFLPVSALAAALYTAALFCLVWNIVSDDEDTRTLAARALLVMAGAIVGSAVWFILIQIFDEGAFCKYCMAVHSIGIVLSVLLLRNLLRTTARGWWLFLLGILAAAGLAVFQALTVPDAVYQEGLSETDLPFIEPEGWPVVGNPDAEYVVDLLFDYQCSHCQKLHGMLPEIVDAFGGRVAFVMCPSPLSPECNTYIPWDDNRFAGSCDLAKIALALYRLDKNAFRKFDSWAFETPSEGKWSPRSVSDAYALASSLTDAERLVQVLDSEELRVNMSKTVELFGRSTSDGKGGIPRLVFGNRWIVPEADTPEAMVSIMEKEFQIKAVE